MVMRLYSTHFLIFSIRWSLSASLLSLCIIKKKRNVVTKYRKCCLFHMDSILPFSKREVSTLKPLTMGMSFFTNNCFDISMLNYVILPSFFTSTLSQRCDKYTYSTITQCTTLLFNTSKYVLNHEFCIDERQYLRDAIKREK
jgi:hypothetical protein